MLITLASIMNLMEPDMMMTTITVGTSIAQTTLWIQLGIMAIPPSTRQSMPSSRGIGLTRIEALPGERYGWANPEVG
jgi:hypothetical protein